MRSQSTTWNFFEKLKKIRRLEFSTLNWNFTQTHNAHWRWRLILISSTAHIIKNELKGRPWPWPDQSSRFNVKNKAKREPNLIHRILLGTVLGNEVQEDLLHVPVEHLKSIQSTITMKAVAEEIYLNLDSVKWESLILWELLYLGEIDVHREIQKTHVRLLRFRGVVDNRADSWILYLKHDFVPSSEINKTWAWLPKINNHLPLFQLPSCGRGTQCSGNRQTWPRKGPTAWRRRAHSHANIGNALPWN